MPYGLQAVVFFASAPSPLGGSFFFFPQVIEFNWL
jgi:hypothetical protein